MASGQGLAPCPLTRAGSAGSAGPGPYARAGPGQPGPRIPGSIRVARSRRRMGEDPSGGSASATSDSLSTALTKQQALQNPGLGPQSLGLSASRGVAPCAAVEGSAQLAGAVEASGLRAAAKLFAAPGSAASSGRKPRGRPPGTRRSQRKIPVDSQQSGAGGFSAPETSPGAAGGDLPEDAAAANARSPLHADVMRPSAVHDASRESRKHVLAALRLAALQQGAESVFDWKFGDSHAQEPEASENLLGSAASRDRGQTASTSSSRRSGARSTVSASGASIDESILEDALAPTAQMELASTLPHSRVDSSLRLIAAAHAAAPGWLGSSQSGVPVASASRLSSASPSSSSRLSGALPSSTSTFASGADPAFQGGIDGVSELPWFAGVYSVVDASPAATVASSSPSGSGTGNGGSVNGSVGIVSRAKMATPLQQQPQPLPPPQQQQQQQEMPQQGGSGYVNGSSVGDAVGSNDMAGESNKGLGFVRKVTRGNVTWVRLTRREEGEEEEEEGEEGGGVGEEESEGGVSGENGKVEAGRANAKKIDARHGPAASSLDGSNTSAAAAAPLRRGPGRPRLPRADVSEDWSARGEVEADDVDVIMSRLETKYHPVQDLEALQRNVKFLLGLGARRGQVMRLIGRQPELLSRCVEEEAEALASVLVGFQVPRMAMLRALAKSLDCLAAEPGQVEGVLGYLDKELGVNNLGRVVATSPHLLGQSVPELVATVSLLEGGLEVDDVGAALEKNPALLGWGKEDVEEKVAALGHLVGRGGDGGEGGEESVDTVAAARQKRVVREMVCSSAQLMLASPHDAMETYGRLVRLLGEENASRVAAAQPQVLAMEGEEVETSLGQLIAVFGQALAALMLEENGFLVRRKWAKTQAKLTFLTEEMGRDVAQVAAWPKVLTFNLQTRLQRRYAVLQDQMGPGAGSKDSLRSIFGCPDAVFERRFGVKLPPIVKGKRGRRPKNQEELEE